MTWIVPRDSWLLDRAALQPGPEFAADVAARFAARSVAIEEAESADDLLEGTLPSGPDVLYVDCTADGLERRRCSCAGRCSARR